MPDLPYYLHEDASGIWKEGNVGTRATRLFRWKDCMPHLYELQQ